MAGVSERAAAFFGLACLAPALLGFVVLCVGAAHCVQSNVRAAGTTDAKGLVSKHKANQPRQHEAQTVKCDFNYCHKNLRSLSG